MIYEWMHTNVNKNIKKIRRQGHARTQQLLVPYVYIASDWNGKC